MTEPADFHYAPPTAEDIDWSDYLAMPSEIAHAAAFVDSRPEHMTITEWALGRWLSPLLDDPCEVCDEFKTAIQNWFNELEARYGYQETDSSST